MSAEQTRPTFPQRRSASSVEVAEFLRANPDWLAEHPEILQALAPPNRAGGDNVLDLQHFMVRRLQDEVGRLNGHQRELLAATRSNLSAQGQVHEAVLLMLEAASFEHLIHIVTRDVAQALDLDAVTLCVEALADGPHVAKTPGVYVLEPHGVDSRIGQGRDVLLANDIPADPAVFGPAAGLVKSQALARLHASRRSPAGLLALGSRDADKFHAGQASELLTFLARTLERLIRGWLHLPA
jgi:uncharacterized protein YigA (DUF484 family)